MTLVNKIYFEEVTLIYLNLIMGHNQQNCTRNFTTTNDGNSVVIKVFSSLQNLFFFFVTPKKEIMTKLRKLIFKDLVH